MSGTSLLKAASCGRDGEATSDQPPPTARPLPSNASLLSQIKNLPKPPGARGGLPPNRPPPRSVLPSNDRLSLLTQITQPPGPPSAREEPPGPAARPPTDLPSNNSTLSVQGAPAAEDRAAERSQQPERKVCMSPSLPAFIFATPHLQLRPQSHTQVGKFAWTEESTPVLASPCPSTQLSSFQMPTSVILRWHWCQCQALTSSPVHNRLAGSPGRQKKAFPRQAPAQGSWTPTSQTGMATHGAQGRPQPPSRQWSSQVACPDILNVFQLFTVMPFLGSNNLGGSCPV